MQRTGGGVSGRGHAKNFSVKTQQKPGCAAIFRPTSGFLLVYINFGTAVPNSFV